jgi:hypothetical protein
MDVTGSSARIAILVTEAIDSAPSSPNAPRTTSNRMKVQMPTGDTTVINVADKLSFADLVSKMQTKRKFRLEHFTTFVSMYDGTLIQTKPDENVLFFISAEKVILYGTLCTCN